MSYFYWRAEDGTDALEVQPQWALPVGIYTEEPGGLNEVVGAGNPLPTSDRGLFGLVQNPIRYAGSITFTRPANATAMAAGDVISASATDTIGTAFYVPNMARVAGGVATLVAVRGMVSNTAQTSRVRFQWFKYAPLPAEIEMDDNAVFAYSTQAGRDKWTGSTLIGAWNTKGNAELEAAQGPLLTAPADTGLFVVVTTEDAETPPNAGVYRFDFYTL